MDPSTLLPIIDLDMFRQRLPGWRELCDLLLTTLEETSCLIVRDSQRISKEKNELFLNTMEGYFSQPSEVLLADSRPEYDFQVGITPENTEVPRDHMATISSLKGDPVVPKGADPKWKFFRQLGKRPHKTNYAKLYPPHVIPTNFPHAASIMDDWGKSMLQTLYTVAEMIAIAMGLNEDALTKLMEYGPHLLGPSACDLSKHNALNTVIAGLHYDLNFLTIHGKPHFPGLTLWMRNKEQINASVPDGCLLVQAGKQLEWISGGNIIAGLHQVTIRPDTLVAIELRKANNQPLWRVSSTVFGHVSSDNILQPMGKYSKNGPIEDYPPIPAGEQVEKELIATNLKKS